MDNPQPYETLDPENWDEMRALAHRMVDDALTYLQTVRERPVWQPVPEQVAAHFEEKAPHEPGRAEAAYERICGEHPSLPDGHHPSPVLELVYGQWNRPWCSGRLPGIDHE